MDTLLNIQQIPREPQSASKYLVEVLFSKIYPLILRIRNQLQADIETEADIANVQSVFTLCCSQIKKCLLNLFEIFKLENEQGILLQDSRQFTLDRLSWCVNRLVVVEEKLDIIIQNPDIESCDDSLFSTPMYFVNWMDHTFEVLSKLAGIIYKTDYNENEGLHFEWKMELLECVSLLHTSLDELLLSAMTLCKYCLPCDQIIVKTRCQVVLREAKVLLNELIEGNTDGKFTATINSLKLPIMPTNVNVSIDVLKDVLYVLETNTNTALLALVVHCFSNTVSPVDRLRDHLSEPGCSHHDGNEEDCEFVTDFDLYSERLLQIGSFAVSCSSDQERIVSLRSGLASLEALEPALVPALQVAPRGAHAQLLAACWRAELRDIRDAIFLIVDPAAFTERSKQLMHENLRQLFGKATYDNAGVCSVIELGGVLRDLFAVYRQHEPEALPGQAALLPLLKDLDKALLECKVVSNLLCGKEDFVYDVKKPTQNKEVSMEQLSKRLKLLYTLVNRINRLLHPEDSQDQFFKSDIEDPPTVQNATYTLNMNGNTYNISSPKKITNVTRSIFAKTAIRTPAKKFPLKKLAQQIKAQRCNELNFSVQLDQMFNLSELEKPDKNRVGLSISTHKNSILYNVSPRKNRASLRKMVLNKCYNLSEKQLEGKMSSEMLVKESLIDDTTSLQISEILDEMHDMTKLLSKPKCNSTTLSKTEHHRSKNTSISKYLRSIPADASTLEMRLDESEGNATVPSDVSTLERLSDLNRIENKLCNLKLLHKETRL